MQTRLHDLGRGVFAYTQLPGSWGYSNSGLITDGEEALLVDTLFDLKLTAQMLDTMRDAAPSAQIGTVVNTHGNGDHCYGNSLVSHAEIIASEGTAEDLRIAPASRNATLLRAGSAMLALGGAGRALGRLCRTVGIHRIANLAEAAPLAIELFQHFDFAGVPLAPPTRTFTGQLDLRVGDKRVELIEVGPAHTLGDTVVWVPEDRTLFTGDILFKDAHPLVWEGPVSNWIAACDRLLALEPVTVVPGHGHIGDGSGLRETKHYLEVLTEQARLRYEAGMTVDEAVADLALDEFAGWIDAERVYVNVHTLYREFTGDTEPADILALFAGMARTGFRTRATPAR
jgi:glyoxylase-like metal-dependent hydrolase (beta-lactamase superfamily II)